MKKSVLLFALCMFILAGCNQEPQDVIDQEECQVEISFTNDFTKSLLKATTTAEGTMSEVILFGVDINDDYVGKYSIVAPIVGVNSVNISKRVHTLYAIANPSPAIKALTNQDKAALDGLVESFATAPATPLLMGGSGVISVSGSNYTVNIALIRSMAKVVFSTTTTGLVINSVTANNTPAKAYVFKQASASVAEPEPTNRVGNYAPVPGTDTAPVYVCESANTTNVTTFTVNGTFDGKTANYTITLKDGSMNIPIERNKQYNVSVNATSTTDCAITITIPDWTDVPAGNYEIPYDDFTTQP